MLFHRVVPGTGFQHLIGAEEASLRFLELDRLALAADQAWMQTYPEREAVIVPLLGSGVLDHRGAGDVGGITLERADVFTAPPSAAYLPRGLPFTIRSRSALEVVIVTAPVRGAAAPVAIPAGAVRVSTVGVGAWRREVRLLLPPDGPATRLIVGETVNPPGHWSGMPPHKHDEAGPEENLLEEVYYYRLAPPNGYLVQVFYDRRGWTEAHLITNEGALVIPRGYHPTVAAPGTTGYYLWAIAGEEKSYRVSVDSAFDWMQDAPASGPGTPQD